MTETRQRSFPGAPRHERWIRKLLLCAGVVELAVGSLHFAIPASAYQSKGFPNLQPDELSFVTLVTFAVGILLVAFGTFTVYLASRTEAMVDVLFWYSLIKAFLWTGRVVLELAYPVRLRLFSVEPFTAVVMPGLVFELLLFVASAVAARRALAAGVAGGNVLTD